MFSNGGVWYVLDDRIGGTNNLPVWLNFSCGWWDNTPEPRRQRLCAAEHDGAFLSNADRCGVKFCGASVIAEYPDREEVAGWELGKYAGLPRLWWEIGEVKEVSVG